VDNCESIIDPGLEMEDWVEVKHAGESILHELTKISQFNDVYCFESCERYKEYLKERKLGRDRVGIHLIDTDGKLNLDDESPPLLSQNIRPKVIEIIRFANGRIRQLSLQMRTII